MKRAAIVLLCVGPWAATALGFWLGSSWLLPILCAAVPFPAFLLLLRGGQIKNTFVWMSVWALMQSLATVVLAWHYPDHAYTAILRGPEYAAEMLHWIRTGVGPEGDPSLFLPIHLRHTAAFSVLCFLSYGLLGLVLGSVLLNYMNFYVVALVRESLHPVQAAGLGWPLWAVLRVLGFMALAIGFALAGKALYHRLRGKEPVSIPKAPFVWGSALVLSDALLKALLAPIWREWLMGALGL